MSSLKFLPIFLFTLILSACGSDNDEPTGKIGIVDYPEPATITYDINTETSGSGTLSPVFAQVEEGERVIFKIEADDGFVVETVEGCDGSLEETSYIVESVSQNCSIHATFMSEAVAPLYTISTNSTLGGVITPSVLSVSEKGSATFTLAADDGYLVHLVEGCDGEWVDDTYEVSNAIADCTVDVRFIAKPFITTWAVKANQPVVLKLPDAYIHDVLIDWGDGSDITPAISDTSHVYGEAGEYTVKVFGNLPAIELCSDDAAAQVTDVAQWGRQEWQSMASMFANCSLIEGFSAIDSPDLSQVTSMASMFASASKFNGDLSNWNVGSVTDMSAMFQGTFVEGSYANADYPWDHYVSNFNGDIASWDVSSVTNMGSMFHGAVAFEGDVSRWDVSQVTNMSHMFASALAFNADVSNWNVSSVTDMSGMFKGAYVCDSYVYPQHYLFCEPSLFNADLSNWDVSNVTDMSGMFKSAIYFNADLSNWDVSKVTNMSEMFWSALSFEGDMPNWDVSQVTSMAYMFAGADEYHLSKFAGDISAWDVSRVKNMSNMFAYASSFNSALSGWDVSNVTNMSFMFFSAHSFNGDITSWDVSSAVNMNAMFSSATDFNSDLSNWNVGSITDMSFMFNNAKAFSSDLSKWDVSNVTQFQNFSNGSNISQEPIWP